MAVKNHVLTSLFITALLAMPLTGHTQEAGSNGDFKFVAAAGITFGGDNLTKVRYYDDDDDYLFSDNLEAGGLIYLGGGGNYRFANSPISLQGLLAYHFDSVDADNGDASIDRWVFDLTAFYHIGDHHRLGLGLTRHFSPHFEQKIDSQKVKVDFDDATGFLVEYNYLFTESAGIGLRYTDIEYEAPEILYDSVNASNVGLFVYGLF